MRFRNVTRFLTLGVFVLLLVSAVGFAGADIFLRLDPTIGFGTLLAARAVTPALLPAMLILLSVPLLGRFFCGHICPMGTTLDIMERAMGGSQSARAVPVKSSLVRNGRYILLMFIGAAALGGVSLVYLGSPLSLVTRFYSLTLIPVGILTAVLGLDLGTPLLLKLGLHNIAHWDIHARFFAANLFTGLLFLGIAATSRIQPRFWCRYLCPTGALLGLCSHRPLIRRRVDASCTDCGRCIQECPVSAIGESPEATTHADCLVCLKCVEVCPVQAVSFDHGPGPQGAIPSSADPSRRGLLAALAGGLFLAGLFRSGMAAASLGKKDGAPVDPELIRPPAALPEIEFLSRCVRCGECMNVCPTNAIQPTWLKAGPEGLFTPIMHLRLGACAVGCNSCGKVCPTGAIRQVPLVEKQHAKIGTAYVIRNNCLVWEQDRKCLVCDEACPYNAISFRAVPGLRNAAPFVIENRCLGCGWCENKCPVRGSAAIRVNVIGEVRLESGSFIAEARRYGLVFRAKDNRTDTLGPCTFDTRDSVPPSAQEGRSPKKERESLPPGFTQD